MYMIILIIIISKMVKYGVIINYSLLLLLINSSTYSLINSLTIKFSYDNFGFSWSSSSIDLNISLLIFAFTLFITPLAWSDSFNTENIYI